MAKLTVQGNLDALEEIRQFVTKEAETAGLEKRSLYKLVLAIDEIASNIISYGYGEHDMSGNIDLATELTGDELIITLEDTAPPYDPNGTDVNAEEEIKKPLDERDIGGLGVFLALNGVDRFDYELRDNKNRNTFAMRIVKEGTDT